MTDTSSRRRTHRLLTGLGAAAASLVLTATVAPAPATAGPDDRRGGSYAESSGRPVDVMTRNLYLGADLNAVIFALIANPTGLPDAAKSTWEAVQATLPEERMAAIADEIARAKPAAVGLQEVTRWTTYDANLQPTVRYDFLDLLLKALADRGVNYHEVEGATAHNFASPPIPLAAGSGAAAVSLADRDVILVRDDVKTQNAQVGTFTARINLPLPPAEPGGEVTPLPVLRGWGSVDVRTKHASFRFVNSHLEAFDVPGRPGSGEALRVAQVAELLAAQEVIAQGAQGDLPTVYVGDYNSDAPDGAAYQALIAGVGEDAWLETQRKDSGFTCCFDALVTDENHDLDSRIDLVVTDRRVEAKWTDVVGEEVSDMTSSGLWPSDHAGVVARLKIDDDHNWRDRGHDRRHDRR